LATSMRAVPSPRPDAPPVTINTLPAISMVFLDEKSERGFETHFRERRRAGVFDMTLT
jgi:hypothetical protein